jgi:diguanylate cyclase (GGDEF)-like protein
VRRLLTSWLALTGLLVLLIIGTAAILQQIKGQMLVRAQQEEVQTAQVVTALVVTRNVVGTDLLDTSVAPSDRQDMDADVAELLIHHQLVGLQVWKLDGQLLYADPNNLKADRTLPAQDVRHADAGKPWITILPSVDPADVRIHEVFLPYDSDRDGSNDGIVEVVLPESRIADEIQHSMIELYAIAAVLLVALVGVLAGFRRRLLAREHEALHDPLTGLPNRAALALATRLAIADARDEEGRHAALLVLDLDRFKSVNDTLGHPAGDSLLIQVAGALRAMVRPTDVVARLGGDEFAILLTRLPSAAQAEGAALNLLDHLGAGSYNVNGIDLGVDASIGVALLPEHGTDVDLLLQRADVAMYQAKRANAGVTVYDESTDSHDVTQLGLLVELRRAIEHDELVLHYQPKTDLLTGDLRGVEALVRWLHPTRGELAPGAFIPLAENTGLMQPLTHWVLRHAIAEAARWHDAGLMIAVAVNISPRSLLDRDFPRMLLRLLADAGLPADLLELEITETAIMVDPSRADQLLRELKAMGVRVAIDDFGVGYTSLAYLKSLPVHTLKIDRCFIAEMLHSERDQAIVESVINLGHRLGLTVLAEGIETEPVLDRLKSLHCDQGQGYYIGRPMPVDQLNGWITSHLLGSRASASAPSAGAHTEGW